MTRPSRLLVDRAFNFLGSCVGGVVTHATWVVIVATALTAGSLMLAKNLRIDTDLANLIPSDYPSAVALEKLRNTIGGEAEAAVAIESPSFEANKAYAEALIPEVLGLVRARTGEPFFQRVEYRKEVTFLKDNALYFATPAELDMLEDWLRTKIEDAKLDANPFMFDLEEDEDLVAEEDSVGEELKAIYEQIVSKEYPISDDSTTMVLEFFPADASSNISFIRDAYEALDSLTAALAPARFHADMEVTTAGRLLRQMIEIETIQNDVLGSFGSGAGAVLLFVVLYFMYKAYVARMGRTWSGRIFLSQLLRAPAMALIIGLPLIMSLSWTFALAWLVHDTLNLMTSTLGLVLFGLGIDFGIHFYGRYAEERSAGKSVLEAVRITFRSTGQAITIGAFTTSLGLFVLVLADFKGFSQFGFIAGSGILFALIAMIFVLPALLAVFERFGLLNLSVSVRRAEDEGRTHRTTFPGCRIALYGSMAAVVVAFLLVGRVGFEYRFGQLEPVYEEYEARRDIVRKVSDNRRNRNPAYVILDGPEEVEPVINALRQQMAADTLSPTIDRVESLQDRFPAAPGAQAERLARLAGIRALLADRFLEREESEDLDRLRRAAQTRAPIAEEDVPQFLREQFTSKSGELGSFVIIYPSVGLSDGRQSIAFSEDVGTIVTDSGKVYHAGSTSLVAADMLKLMRSEAPWMVLATLLIVMVLMYANFGSLKWMFLALLPLLVGVLWMLLLMELMAFKLNFYNLIVLPAVLGIGNDAGVHLVHRYREEGTGSIMHVLRSTGEHVTMGSLTTMLGFAGLLLSFHPGLESIGMLAVIGIGSTLAAALFFLPALLQRLEMRDSASR